MRDRDTERSINISNQHTQNIIQIYFTKNYELFKKSKALTNIDKTLFPQVSSIHP